MSIWEDLILSYNLGKTDASLGTQLVPNIPNYGVDNEGRKYLTYTFFRSASDVDQTYWNNTPVEFEFVSSYDSKIEDAAEHIMTDSGTWSASFENVLKVNFATPGQVSSVYEGDIGVIAFSQLAGTYPTFSNEPATGAITFADYDTDAFGSSADEVYGDILVNMDHESYVDQSNRWTDYRNASGDIEAGTWAYKALYEEISHALGIDVFLPYAAIDENTVLGDLLRVPISEATQKYSITSYATYGQELEIQYDSEKEQYFVGTTDDPSSVTLWGEDMDGDGIQDRLHAYGLQLYDIAALQELYGANTNTRTGDDTYKLDQGLGRKGDKTKAFIYTIWDAGGDDTLDASDFDTNGVKLGRV